MKKVKNFLLNKGIYLIAIGCVAIVSLSGLYIANVMNKNGNEANPNNSAASSTSDAQDAIALPTRKADGATESPQAATPTPDPNTSGGASTSPSATPSPTPNSSGKPSNIKLALPVKGTILVDYAMDKLVYNKTLDEWRTHSGVDIAAPMGTEVKAAADGKVVDVKKDPRLGYLIIIEHNDSLKTIYANLKEETDVKIGDSIKKGDLIGWVGKTAPFEFADDPHLHFEVVLNDKCVNVWDYANKE